MGIKLLVLEEIIARNYSKSVHARIRMSQRNITDDDIVECATTGNIKEGADGKFTIIGFDCDGEDLKVICAYAYGVLIVTVY